MESLEDISESVDSYSFEPFEPIADEEVAEIIARLIYKDADEKFIPCVKELVRIICGTPNSNKITLSTVIGFASVPLTRSFACAK
jgi:hypothetical protein